MKNRTDSILLNTFFLSLILYFFAFPCFFAEFASTGPRWAYLVFDWLSWYFHAIPAFCLQLLLCRKIRHRFAVLPTLFFVVLALWSAYGCSTHDGWDALGYEIFLQLSAAPAVGCVLAWAVYGWTKKTRP